MLPPVTAERQTYCSPVYLSNGHLAGSLCGPRESTGDRKILNKMRSASAAGSSAIPVFYSYEQLYIYIYNLIYTIVVVKIRSFFKISQ